MSQSTADFLDRLRRFVLNETNAQRSALEFQWSRPLGERVAKGWAIEGVRVEKFDKGIAHLSCTTNDSRFREGDLIVLHRGFQRDEDA